MQEAILYQKSDNLKVRCNVCARRCVIKNKKRGYCETRLNQGGKLYSLIYGLASSVCVDPIEKKPVFHYQPGGKVLSLGSWGCNFRCIFCQNYNLTYINGNDLENIAEKVNGVVNNSEVVTKKGILKPEAVIELARKENCQGIAFTYNEPTIWLEYTLEIAKLAKKVNLYTVYVTNGYITTEALDQIGPYLDVWRVDIKSMDDKFYQEVAKIPSISPILESTIRAKKKWKTHIEVVTNIIPGLNDSDDNLKKTADWIAQNLGSKTPWHATRFFPYLKLRHLSPTPIETLERAQEIGKKAGLEFVYLGNVGNYGGENTFCPKCGSLVIERINYKINKIGLNEKGKCSNCNEDLNIIT